MAEDAGNVKVFCRVRPPNEREGGAFAASMAGRDGSSAVLASSFVKKCIVVPTSDPLQQTVFLQSRHASSSQNSAPKTFTFDRAFGENATQNDVFEVVGMPITQACLQGYNGTIFAYGQTGSGKTFTMQGPDHVIDMDANRLSAQEIGLRGLVPRVFDYLFDDVVAASKTDNSTSSTRAFGTNVQHTFACSFLEIYNERVYDLLDGGSTKDPTGLQLRENGRKGVFVEGLIESVVTNAKQAAELMTLGAQNRRVGQTAMNRESSRSHSVFILQIQSKETTPDGITKMRSSRFNLVDLAGSERQRNTEAAGERLKEAGSINKSLSALGNVIMGLVEQSAGKNRHVHYRDSKLTFLLKDSLGGNSKTFMIATISPAEDSAYETLSTLKFAQRAKLIRNNAVINEDSTGSVLVLQEEIQRLRRQLHQAHVESVRMPHESSSLALMQSSSMMATEASSSSMTTSGLGQQCDPAIDGRFRELEAAFATSIEKNSQLKRSHEHLKLQEEHLKALCTEMKRNITHLKMVLRLRQQVKTGGSSGDDMEKEEMMMDYEPSVDAIEWRLKYEELEENFAELQDEVQQRRMAENFAGGKEGGSGHIEGEIESLNLMLLALTKQLAYVVRDKHELQDRLAQLTKTADDGDDADIRSSDDEQKVTLLQQALKTQAHELNAKINALAAAKYAAEDKAREASFELLEMKQKEVAWKIQGKERDIRLEDAVTMLQQTEEARTHADGQLKQEKQRHHELLLRAEQEREQMRLDLEVRFADLHTSNQQLVRDHEKLNEEARTAREERDAFEQKSKEVTDQVAKLLSDLSKSASESSDKSLKIDSLLNNLTITNGKLDDANATIQRDEELVSELRGNVASLEATSESLRQDLHAKNDELSQLQAFTNETDRELSHSKVEVSELKQRNSDVISELENVAAAFEKLKLSHGDLETLLAKAQSDIEVLRESESTLLNVKVQLEEKCEEGLKKIAAKQEELVKLADDHVQEVNHLSELADAKIRELMTDYEVSLQGKADELKQLQASFDEAMRQSEHKQTALQKTHEERVLAMESARAAFEDDYAQKIAGLEKELGAKQSELEALASDVSRLKCELEEIVSKANALEQQNSELQGIREAQHADLEKSEKAIAALELLNSELAQTRDNLRAEVEERANAIAELQQNKEGLISARDELQAEVEQRELSIQKLSSEVEALNESFEAVKIREESLSNELEASIDQHAQAFEKHSLAVALLKETHAKELDEVKESAEATITELKEALSESKQLVQAKDGDIATLETELQALVAQHEAHKKEAAEVLQTVEKELQSLKKNLGAKASDYLQQEQALQETVHSLQADVERANNVIKTQEGEIEASVNTAELAKEEIAALKKLGASQSVKHEAELKELHLRLKELENRAETKISQAVKAEKEFENVKRSLQTQLEDTEQKLKKQIHVNQELMRKGEQLGLTVDDQQAQLEKSDGKLAAMATELEQTTASMRHTKSDLSAKKTAITELKRALVELQSKVGELEKENRGLHQDRQTKVDLAARAEQLERHSAELEKKKNLVESELKDAEKEKQGAAATRKKLDAVRDDYQKCKMRLEELEPLVIQLKNDKKKLERETLVQSARLENISKENDKLVGHDNKRQKIQYHFKVKEENNRLLGEVRALTDEKFKLQTKLDKLKLVLKEKENFGEAATGLPKRPTPPGGTNSSAGATATSASTIAKKLIPVSSGLGLESSSLAPPKANKKRLHSRIERS